MSEHKKHWSDFESISQLRDELSLQAHLFKEEVKDEWEDMEEKWEDIMKEMAPLKKSAEKTKDDVGAATKLLIQELKDGYHRMKSSF